MSKKQCKFFSKKINKYIGIIATISSLNVLVSTCIFNNNVNNTSITKTSNDESTKTNINISTNDNVLTTDASVFMTGKEGTVKGTIGYTIANNNEITLVADKTIGVEGTDVTFNDGFEVGGIQNCHIVSITFTTFVWVTRCCTFNGSITFPQSLKTIGDGAFRNNEITSMDFTKCTSLTSIGSNAFSLNPLTSIDLSNCIQLKTVNGFFSNTKLAEIKLPPHISTIAKEAFRQCYGLTTIDFSNCTELTKIESIAFQDCSGLSSISLPSSLETIGESAFDGCPIEDANLNGNEHFKWANNVGTGFVLLNGNSNTWDYQTTPIGCLAYGDIDMSQFSGDKIKDELFSGCAGITSVNLSNNANLTSIGENAFNDCKRLTSLDLSKCTNLTTIYDSAFENCNGLTTISWPLNLTTIDDYAFSNCDGLTSVNLSNCTSLTTIGVAAFYNCTILRWILLPSSLTSIDSLSFNNDSNIEKVNFNFTKTQIENLDSSHFNNLWLSNAVGDKISNIKISVPYGLEDFYKSTDVKQKLGIDGSNDNNFDVTTYEKDISLWIKNATGGKIQYGILNGLQIHFISIGNNIQCNNPYITGNFNDGSTFPFDRCIGNELFKGKTGLTGTLTIDSSITSIGVDAFDRCSGITSIELEWTKTQLDNFFNDKSASPISSTWLGSLNNSEMKVKVPGEYMSSYLQYADKLGINKCQIEGDINGSDWIKDGDTKGKVVINFNLNDNTFEIVNGRNIVCSNPKITNTITYNGKNYTCSKITDEAFKDNLNIKGNVTIDKTITSIGENAFGGCNNIDSFHLEWDNNDINNIITSTTFSNKWLGSLNNPKTLIFIHGKYAENYTVNQVALGIDLCIWDESDVRLDKIINHASGTCWLTDSTDSVIINLVELESNLVNASLNDFYVVGDVHTTIKGIAENCFANKDMLHGNFTLPSTITYIGNDAFSGCTNLTSITLSWTQEQLEHSFDANSDDKINVESNWLGEKSNYKIIVPKHLKKVYEKYKDQLGISNNQIVDPSDSNNLALGLGLGLGLGIPVLGGAIAGTVIGVKKYKNKKNPIPSQNQNKPF